MSWFGSSTVLALSLSQGREPDDLVREWSCTGEKPASLEGVGGGEPHATRAPSAVDAAVRRVPPLPGDPLIRR